MIPRSSFTFSNHIYWIHSLCYSLKPPCKYEVTCLKIVKICCSLEKCQWLIKTSFPRGWEKQYFVLSIQNQTGIQRYFDTLDWYLEKKSLQSPMIPNEMLNIVCNYLLQYLLWKNWRDINIWQNMYFILECIMRLTQATCTLRHTRTNILCLPFWYLLGYRSSFHNLRYSLQWRTSGDMWTIRLVAQISVGYLAFWELQLLLYRDSGQPSVVHSKIVGGFCR